MQEPCGESDLENPVSLTKIVSIWLFLKFFILGVEDTETPTSSALHRQPKLLGQDFQPSNHPPTPLLPGVLWQLGPLVLCAEPAAAAHRGPLHPPHPTGLARAHRHPHGAPRMPGQVRLSAVSWGRCERVHLCSCPTSPPTPVRAIFLWCKCPARKGNKMLFHTTPGDKAKPCCEADGCLWGTHWGKVGGFMAAALIPQMWCFWPWVLCLVNDHHRVLWRPTKVSADGSQGRAFMMW